jgi:hypothetical protein
VLEERLFELVGQGKLDDCGSAEVTEMSFARWGGKGGSAQQIQMLCCRGKDSRIAPWGLALQHVRKTEVGLEEVNHTKHDFQETKKHEPGCGCIRRSFE